MNPFAWYYPERAQRMEIDGKAVMSCDVTEEGRLTACELVSETPEGYGFGAATLEVSRYFKLKPKLDADGKPVPGGRINFPLTWSLPKDEPPTKAR
jgi:protein TonB